MVHATKQTTRVRCPCVNTPRSSFNKARKGSCPLLSSIIRSRDDKGTLSMKSEHAEEDFEGFDHKFRLSFRSVTSCPVISFCTSCFEVFVVFLITFIYTVSTFYCFWTFCFSIKSGCFGNMVTMITTVREKEVLFRLTQLHCCLEKQNRLS